MATTGTHADAPEVRCTAKPDFRLTRARRLDPAGYRGTFDQGRSFAGRCLVLWSRPAEGETRRVGVVASRRSFPTAVARNRARRLLRETFRLNRAGLRPGVDLVLVARPKMREVTFTELGADFRQVCARAGVWGPTA